MNRILTIVGARPQFVKASVVSLAFKNAGIQEDVIHTGQHYDPSMSAVFWDELNIPKPTQNFDVGSGSHAVQTAAIMVELEKYLLSKKSPRYDGILVYGDTNSTVAAALVSSKLHIPLIHVEAGLRSFNKKMPEEVNRIMTDHVSDLLFCSSEIGVKQLEKEGITEGVYNVGDVMYDAVTQFSALAESKLSLRDIIPFDTGNYYLATIHRPSNTDNEAKLEAIISSFAKIDKKVVWPVHPRNNARLNNISLPDNLHIISPLPYLSMLIVLKNSALVFTDSGGLQKEAYWLKKQCITLREETEWVETLEGGWNTLAGHRLNELVSLSTVAPTTPWEPIYGDGEASLKIADIIKEYKAHPTNQSY